MDPGSLRYPWYVPGDEDSDGEFGMIGVCVVIPHSYHLGSPLSSHGQDEG